MNAIELKGLKPNKVVSEVERRQQRYNRKPLDNTIEPKRAERLHNKVAKWKAQKGKRNEPREIINCSCGNKIRIFNKKSKILCYKCNHYHIKEKDKWTKQHHKDTVRFADLKIVSKGNKKILAL